MHDIRTFFVGKRSFFILIILGLFVINAIWLIPTLRNTRLSASVFALTVAERIKSEINSSLGNTLNEIIGVGGEVAEEPERTIITFENLLRYHPIFTNISLVNRSGKEFLRIDSSGPLPPEKFIDQSRNTSFYLALQGRTTFTSPIILPNGEAHVTLVIPVPKRGEFIDKVIIADLNVQNLLSIIRSPDIGQGHVYVLDRDGVQILNPDIAKISQRQDFSSRRIVKKVLVDGATADGLAQDDQYINDAGEDTFAVGMPIPVVKWGVFVEQPRLQALAGEQQTIVLAIVTSLLAIIIFLVIAFSITKLRGLTILLGKANEELRKLDQAKSDFISIASHQLRTPLTIIKGYISLIREGTVKVPTERGTQVLGRIAISTDQLVKLVNNMLNLSRMDAGGMKYSFAKNNLATVVADVVKGFEIHAKERGVTVKFLNNAPDLQPFDFDIDKIQESATNLVDNGIKYTKKGEILTSLDYSDSTKTGVRVSVKDSGIGLKPEDIPRLFTKFVRTQEAIRTDPGGTGIGLYFVKCVMNDHGGTIGVSSQGVGKGSTFWFELPTKDKGKSHDHAPA